MSRLGGLARSEAKTIANRRKIREFWRAVRCGERVPPRRGRKASPDMLRLAKTYLWWQLPEESVGNPVRLVAQVMDIGTWDDCILIGRLFGRPLMKAALKNAQPGWFRPRSWTYWHYRLGLTPWGDEVPKMPMRRYESDSRSASDHRHKAESFVGGSVGPESKVALVAQGKSIESPSKNPLAPKLKIVMQRVETKEYRDIAALLRSGLSLPEGLAGALALFGEQFSAQECARALVYFRDPGLSTVPSEDRQTILGAVQKLAWRSMHPAALKSKRLGFQVEK